MLVTLLFRAYPTLLCMKWCLREKTECWSNTRTDSISTALNPTLHYRDCREVEDTGMDVQQADTQGKQVGQVMHTCFIQLGSYTGDGEGVGGGGRQKQYKRVLAHAVF